MDVNKWFLSLPPERKAVLREDKWMLANAAADAAAEAERERCAELCEQEHQESGEHPEMALHCAERIRGLRA